MIVAFDPVAKELVIDPENGLEPLSINAVRLEARYYADDGMFAVLLGERSLEVYFTPAPDVPVRLRVDALAPNRWLVRLDGPGIGGTEEEAP